MSDYWLFRKGDALYAADERSERFIRRMFEGEAMQLELERSRSWKWHKMYVSCCISIGENQDPERAWQSIDQELRIRSGHYSVMVVGGHDVFVPDRIAFKKLTADQWTELWPKLDRAMLEHFGFDREASREFA